MSKHNTPQLRGQSEGNTHVNQQQTIFQYLNKYRATASMVPDASGIYENNICRYKRDIGKGGAALEIENMQCKKTGFRAWYLTTKPDKAPKILLTL